MKKFICGMSLTLSLFAAGIGSAWAGQVTFDLVRLSLDIVNNPDDDTGAWQHEGGQVLKNGQLVGYYAINRRTTSSATLPYNTAMVTATLFLKDDGGAPENITLQGAHDFGSGEWIGSVSAASFRYTWLQGALFTGSAADDTLRIVWQGPNVMRIP